MRQLLLLSESHSTVMGPDSPRAVDRASLWTQHEQLVLICQPGLESNCQGFALICM